MSYNGSGTFQINTSGQPVVAGTVISSTAFNALTADLATGLSTAITKDGQTTTTARIPFAAGINSSLTTDSSSTSTGSIITAGGVGVAKNLYVGVNANIAGTLDVTGAVTVTNPVINNIKMGYTTTATAGGTTTLTAASNHQQFFTGTLAQTIVLPVTSTLALGMSYSIENNSTGTLTVQSSGGNTISTIPAGVTTLYTCILITGTTAASWDYDHIGFAAITGTGSAVLGTAPTIGTPTLGSSSTDTVLITGAPSIGGAGLGMGFAYRNRIINGAMVIDQRGTASAAVSLTTSNQYTVDRWACATGSAPSGTIYGYQVATSTYPFTKALRLYKFAGTYSGNMFATQVIESNNCYDLAGQSVTVSFQARRGSDFAGTLACGVVTGTGTDQGVNGSTGGSWTGYASTNAVSATSLTTSFVTYTGTVSVPAGTNEISINFVNAHTGNAGSSNNWVEITGIQLEKGSTATSFDYRPYGTELALCQRYCPVWNGTLIGVAGQAIGATQAIIPLTYPVTPRTPVTGITTTGTYSVYAAGASGIATTALAFNGSSDNQVQLLATVAVGLVAGNATGLIGSSARVIGTGSEL